VAVVSSVGVRLRNTRSVQALPSVGPAPALVTVQLTATGWPATARPSAVTSVTLRSGGRDVTAIGRGALAFCSASAVGSNSNSAFVLSVTTNRYCCPERQAGSVMLADCV
jgi:hypothetical protein